MFFERDPFYDQLTYLELQMCITSRIVGSTKNIQSSVVDIVGFRWITMKIDNCYAMQSFSEDDSEIYFD